MKAQSFFGGTRPKETGVKVRQVGSSSATSGVNNITNNRGQAQNNSKGRRNYAVPHGTIQRKTKVRQVGHSGSAT